MKEEVRMKGNIDKRYHFLLTAINIYREYEEELFLMR